jgi:hypothetical protein
MIVYNKPVQPTRSRLSRFLLRNNRASQLRAADRQRYANKRVQIFPND